MSEPPRRLVCERCRRPRVVCYCAHIPSLPTRTRVLMLQHPRERKMGIGTAGMAHLSLPNSILRVGVEFAGDPVVAETLAGGPPAYLLFPGEGARDIRELPRGEPITLVVVDGTWSQARTLVKRNPFLEALPRVAFVPRQPSDYRIRRQPAEFCVSTIEALAEVLNLLEEGGRFDSLLDPFRAMVDRQERFAAEIHSNRHAHKKARRQERPSLAARLAADWSRLVCVQGEANGWPVNDPNHQDPEIVHFVACRVATGEIYRAVVAPRRPLAPKTPKHVELTAEQILAGGSVEEWRQSWSAFVRPGDVLAQWGGYYAKLATEDGLTLPMQRMDLRGELAKVRKHGATLDETARQLGAQVTPLPIDGRGGRRLSSLLALLIACRDA